MFAFVLYAVAVWYIAVRYRRQWWGFAGVGGGLVGCLIVIYFHTRLNDWMGGTINLPVLRGIMYPYTALVVAVGVYVACLPRRARRGQCPSCMYNLSGLPHDEVDRCPECGVELGAAPRRPAATDTPHRTLATYRAAAKARQAQAQERATRLQASIAAE